MALFRSLWIGDALSPHERLCIQSFLAHGHEFELFVYRPVANVPQGCRFVDAREILPEDQVFAYSVGPGKGSYSAFSNWFRYKLLLDVGGWWVDTDVVCLTADVSEPAIAMAREDDAVGRVNCAIMRFPAGHPAMRYAYETAVAAGQGVGWAQIGPVLTTETVQRFGLESWLAPTRSFYPIPYREFSATLRPSQHDYVAARTTGATFLHLWNEMIRRAQYNKDCRPPAGSYLRGLFDRHGLSADFRSEYRATEVGDRLQLQVHSLGPQ